MKDHALTKDKNSNSSKNQDFCKLAVVFHDTSYPQNSLKKKFLQKLPEFSLCRSLQPNSDFHSKNCKILVFLFYLGSYTHTAPYKKLASANHCT